MVVVTVGDVGSGVSVGSGINSGTSPVDGSVVLGDGVSGSVSHGVGSTGESGVLGDGGMADGSGNSGPGVAGDPSAIVAVAAPVGTSSPPWPGAVVTIPVAVAVVVTPVG
ncbi:hypothetical protein [Saccharothrix sp. NRRL B-16314]|uniref:hypothetical protein n=1 Tax=Saccharothrix sp. NRRL B-16314 TaxID=1463825 RepID=UPI0005257A9F|nr:hypothetical protein [Saccharothrix sp. NRRL B-16314]